MTPLLWVCVALVLIGLAIILRWGGSSFARPPRAEDREMSGFGDVFRRVLWYLDVIVVSGIGAGLLAAGPGGRLAMRLLGAAAGDGAQGKVTEAEEVVGRITTEGTLGFVLFVGLFAGAITGTLYLLLVRWLPRGRLGGLAFGALLLLVGGTQFEPLRPDNEDFDVVGPGWLSVVTFGLLALAHGALVATLAGRWSRRLPLLGKDRRTLLWYAPLLVLVPATVPAVFVLVVATALISLGRVDRVAELSRSPRVDQVGRIALLAVALVALPFAVGDLIDIAGRGPAGVFP